MRRKATMNNVYNGPPTPEELQRQMTEFMRQHFQGAPQPPPAETEESQPGRDENKDLKTDLLRFNYKPREIKDYLDRFVIHQDEAKKVLSVALCDHYHHVRLALEGKESPNYAKQNIILIGPTGVGKTFLIRNAADLIGVPFVKADATKFSETGYVGGDVEDMVRDLVRLADGDVNRAQYGIIYIDEIDKVAGASNLTGTGRQRARGANQLVEADGRNGGARPIAQRHRRADPGDDGFHPARAEDASTINTKHILFIVSGAFTGLEKHHSQAIARGPRSASPPKDRPPRLPKMCWASANERLH